MGLWQKIRRGWQEREPAEKEIERRYARAPVHKEAEGIERSLLRASLQNLEAMRRVANRAEAMSYYEEILTSGLREKEVQNSKVIGTFCVFTFEELIYAAGAIPIRLCAGFYDTIHPAEEVLPRDICPLIKSSLGFKILRLPYFEFCDVAIVPTSCDGKKKLGEILSDYLPVWILRIPQSKDHLYSPDAWLGEVKILKKKLERLTGRKITRRGLREAVELLHKRQAVFRRLYEVRKRNPPVINGRDAQLVIQASFYDDINRWIKKTEVLCRELEDRARHHLSVCAPGAVRLLLTGAPTIWPNYKLLHIIEESGAIIVIDELCSGTRYLYDPVEVDEWTLDGMLRAIATRYLLPCTCPCFTESDDRIDKLLQMSEDFAVEGVIYHNLRLCQLYDIESGKVREVFKSKGIPMLNLYTDYSGEDIEQIRTRVEAFLEMIRARRTLQ